MKLAIITDSTCDFRQSALDALEVTRVPLYVHFKGETFKDWVEITPTDIIEGIAAGAEIPSTSQPSPQDFQDAYRQAAEGGAEHILCLTISSALSGTYQSAHVAAEQSPVPVTVFDSLAASMGLGNMVRRAAEMRDEGRSLEDIVKMMEHIRDTNFLRFTVDSLDYLKKNGRIGGASAFLGSLLNIKPILRVMEGRVEPGGRARGNKKALKEVVNQIKAYQDEHKRPLVVAFLHIQAEASIEKLRQALLEAGVDFKDEGVYELGSVITVHVGPGTYGCYLYLEP